MTSCCAGAAAFALVHCNAGAGAPRDFCAPLAREVPGHWHPLPVDGAPAPSGRLRAIWSSGQLVTIDAQDLHGVRYSPCDDHSQAITAVAPTGYVGLPDAYPYVQTMGTEVVVWQQQALMGARYDLAHERWRSMSLVGVPDTGIILAATAEPAVYFLEGTGARIVRYDGATDFWRALPPAFDGPVFNGIVPFTTAERLVFSRSAPTTPPSFEFRVYDGAADRWNAPSAVGAPGAHGATAVATTPSGFVLFSGRSIGTNGAPAFDAELTSYDVAHDTWRALPGAPAVDSVASAFATSAYWVAFPSVNPPWNGSGYAYDLAAQHADAIAPEPALAQFSAVTLDAADDGRIVAHDAEGRVAALDPRTRRWTVVNPDPAPSAAGSEVFSLFTGRRLIRWALSDADAMGRLSLRYAPWALTLPPP